MESSEQYNSVPVRDNCALFAPTLLFSGLGFLEVSFKFLPCQPIDYSSAPVKDNDVRAQFLCIYNKHVQNVTLLCLLFSAMKLLVWSFLHVCYVGHCCVN